MWCWRRTQKIGCKDIWRNEQMLHRHQEERNILHTVKRRKANWIGYIWRGKCLLISVTTRKRKEMIEVTVKRGRRSAQLLDDLKKNSRYS
jgi:hypothetical protein